LIVTTDHAPPHEVARPVAGKAAAAPARPLTVAMVAAMPYPHAKASSIRVGHLVRALTASDQHIKVALFAYAGAQPVAPQPRVELHLVPGFDATGTRYYAWGNKLAADVKLIRLMRAQRRRIDLIHCHTIEGLAVALAFKRLAASRAPVCIDIHGPVVPELVHYRLIPDWRPVVALAGWAESLMLRGARHAFVSNEGLKALLGDRIAPEKVSVVFDYVDLDAFQRERLDRGKLEELRRRLKARGETLITYLGMFKDYQGVDYLIRAFAGLAPRHPGLRLLLVGDGPCRAQYEALIRQLGLGDRVQMPGLVPHADIASWLEIADILVSPRIDNEITRAGFVSQMPEYMAAGKPIVSTWVSGCRFLLRDGAGILVEPNDVAALREGLEQALAMTPAEAAACIARAQRNVGQFTWKEGIAEVLEVYRALLAERGS
jgi:glycosyltransferase involved in cell wall biosynthesis